VAAADACCWRPSLAPAPVLTAQERSTDGEHFPAAGNRHRVELLPA
jgi:hypothetical protein